MIKLFFHIKNKLTNHFRSFSQEQIQFLNTDDVTTPFAHSTKFEHSLLGSFQLQVSHKFEEYIQRPQHMFASKQIPNIPQHNNPSGSTTYHKQSASQSNGNASTLYNNHKQSAPPSHSGNNVHAYHANQKHSTTAHSNHAHQSSSSTSHNNGFHKHQQQLLPPTSSTSQPNNGMFQKQSTNHHQLPPPPHPNQHHAHHNLNNGGNMFQDYLQKLTAGQQRSPAKKQEMQIPTPGYFDMNNMSQHFSQQYGQSPYRFTPTPQFAAYAANAAVAANHVHEPVPRYQDHATPAVAPQTQPPQSTTNNSNSTSTPVSRFFIRHFE